jgi:ribonuclease HII
VTRRAAASPARATKPDLELERAAWAAGTRLVAGVDEVGRGALAGPVVAAAVILDPERVPEGLDDSKKLPAARRESLAEQIRASALACHVARVEPDDIDRINILQASFLAMRIAASALAPAAELLLVDGNLAIPSWAGPQTPVVGGDARSASIAAASIVAKVERDRIMCDYDRELPGYDFSTHVGYGTRAHREAIARLGPSTIHRRTFRGVVQLELLP